MNYAAMDPLLLRLLRGSSGEQTPSERPLLAVVYHISDVEATCKSCTVLKTPSQLH